MKVLFIGQNPSKTNIDENVAFVGSKSYGTLVVWMRHLGLEHGERLFVNASKKLGKVGMKDIDEAGLFNAMMNRPDKIVCLGKYSEKGWNKIAKLYGWSKIKTFTLSHPSGLNRKLNDPTYVSSILDKCKEYLNA